MTLLVATCNGQRHMASSAAREHDYTCPLCQAAVILKRGSIKIPHFAHKPPYQCQVSDHETLAHLEAKLMLAMHLDLRQWPTEIEYIIDALGADQRKVDRRADVLTFTPELQPIAIELQHTPISLSDLETRLKAYLSLNIAQLWIPFLDSKYLADQPDIFAASQAAAAQSEHELLSSQLATPSKITTFEIERYSPSVAIRYLHGLYGIAGFWLYHSDSMSFFQAKISPQKRQIKETNWHSKDGEHRAGGFVTWSKRYRVLTLTGPYRFADLTLQVFQNKQREAGAYQWPDGSYATFKINPPKASN